MTDISILLKNYPIVAILLSGYISIHSVYGWHENLGVSDERASEMYKDPILNPDILNTKNKIEDWKSGLQWDLDFIDIFCIGNSPTGSDPDGQLCKQTVKRIYDNCFHHIGIDEECTNPEIQSYMIKHNISGSYDTTYEKIEGIDSDTLTLKETRNNIIANVTNKLCQLFPRSC